MQWFHFYLSREIKKSLAEKSMHLHFAYLIHLMSSLLSSFISFLPAKYNMYKMACTGARICKNFSKNKVSSDILFAWTWRLHKQNWNNLQVKKGFFCRCCQNWFTNVPLKALLPLFWEIFPLFFFLVGYGFLRTIVLFSIRWNFITMKSL